MTAGSASTFFCFKLRSWICRGLKTQFGFVFFLPSIAQSLLITPKGSCKFDRRSQFSANQKIEYQFGRYPLDTVAGPSVGSNAIFGRRRLSLRNSETSDDNDNTQQPKSDRTPQSEIMATVNKQTGTRKRSRDATTTSSQKSSKESKKSGKLKSNTSRSNEANVKNGGISIPVGKPPTCGCNLPACQRTVRKEGPNQGRKFWGCAQWSNKGCKYFEWHVDEEPAAAFLESDASIVGTAIKILTLNVAEFKPHSQAPREFIPQKVFLEELERHRADVLALQELPLNLDIPGYQCIGTVASHCGYVGLFVLEDFASEKIASVKRVLPRVMMMADDIPVVLVTIRFLDGKELVVGSCHLEPFNHGKEIRLAQLQAISDISTKTKSSTMILAGDMNMRQSEDVPVEEIGSWKDAWKEAGSIRREAFTWNSKINHYHAEDSFQFHCRFDRVYLRNAKGVRTFRLMANEPLDNIRSGSTYYLSDHFGIVTTVVI